MSFFKLKIERKSKTKQKVERNIAMLKTAKTHRDEIDRKHEALRAEFDQQQRLLQELNDRLPKLHKEVSDLRKGLAEAKKDISALEAMTAKAAKKADKADLQEILDDSFEAGEREKEAENAICCVGVPHIDSSRASAPTVSALATPNGTIYPPLPSYSAASPAGHHTFEIKSGMDNQRVVVRPPPDDSTTALLVIHSGHAYNVEGEDPRNVTVGPGEFAKLDKTLRVFNTAEDNRRSLHTLRQINENTNVIRDGSGTFRMVRVTPGLHVPTPASQRPGPGLSFDSSTPAPTFGRMSQPAGMLQNEFLKPDLILELLPPPGNKNLVSWLAESLGRIEHDGGSSPRDTILSNACQKKLRSAGRVDDADILASEFTAKNPSWEDVLTRLALAYPIGETDKDEAVDKFNSSFRWEGEIGPILAITNVLRRMDLELDSRPVDDQVAMRLYKSVRQKLPLGYRFLLAGRTDTPWSEILKLIQGYWNTDRSDMKAVGRKKIGKKTTAAICTTQEPTLTPQQRGYDGNTHVYQGTTHVYQGVPGASGQKTAPAVRSSQRLQNRKQNKVLAKVDTTRKANLHKRMISSKNGQAREQRTAGLNEWLPSKQQPDEVRVVSATQKPTALQDGGQNDQRQETTLKNAQEASALASDLGKDYDFWGIANVFQDLGLYTDADHGASLQVCFLRKSPGHTYRNCIARAVLFLNNKIMRNDRENGWVIQDRLRALSPDIIDEVRGDWKASLGGRNKLGLNISTVDALNAYLKQDRHGGVSLTGRARRAEKYFGNRPRRSFQADKREAARENRPIRNSNRWKPPLVDARRTQTAVLTQACSDSSDDEIELVSDSDNEEIDWSENNLLGAASQLEN